MAEVAAQGIGGDVARHYNNLQVGSKIAVSVGEAIESSAVLVGAEW